jgi:hypothetical protein
VGEYAVSYLWQPAWVERHERAAHNQLPAAGSWMPMPWDKARDTLADQISRCADLWSGHDERLRASYEEAASRIRSLGEPETAYEFGLSLPFHFVSIVRARRSP